jgi:hypothetical protein
MQLRREIRVVNIHPRLDASAEPSQLCNTYREIIEVTRLEE